MSSGSVARTYLLHGLSISSDVPLQALSIDCGKPDLRVSLGAPRRIPDEVPPGRPLAQIRTPAGSSSLTRSAAGFTFRIHRRCDFEIDPDVCVIRVHADPEADDHAPALFLGGALAAAVALRGACVLHASAVQTGALTMAFVGASGMGKTTVAALCCASGARLVTDDVLRVETEQGHAWCFRGSSELRLRPAAATLAGALSSSSGGATSDGRVAVRPASAGSARLPLGAIVIPVPSRGLQALRLRRLRGAEALFELVRYPRILGWHAAEAPRRDLDVLGSLATIVPILRVEIPWGPPFPANLGGSLLRALTDELGG
jgi:hypothetical protein